MTCDECQAALKTNPNTAPRAVVAAVAVHLKQCTTCYEALKVRSDRATDHLSPPIKLLLQLQALNVYNKTIADPESRDMISEAYQ